MVPKLLDDNGHVWMPHPGHFICGFDCRFHLNTYTNGYIVSTLGEYFPDAPCREIIAELRGIKLVGMGDERRRDYSDKIGWEDIGHNRKYETMVFKAVKSPLVCCPYDAVHLGGELDFEGYNDSGEAMVGHSRMLRKWSSNDNR